MAENPTIERNPTPPAQGEKPIFLYIRDDDDGINYNQQEAVALQQARGYNVHVLQVSSLQDLADKLVPFQNLGKEVEYVTKLHGATDTIFINRMPYSHASFFTVLQKNVNISTLAVTSCYGGSLADSCVEFLPSGVEVNTRATFTVSRGLPGQYRNIGLPDHGNKSPYHYQIAHLFDKDCIAESLFFTVPEAGFDRDKPIYFSSTKAVHDLLQLSSTGKAHALEQARLFLQKEGILYGENDNFILSSDGPKGDAFQHFADLIHKYDTIEDIIKHDAIDGMGEYKPDSAVTTIELIAAAATAFKPNLSHNTLQANQKLINALTTYRYIEDDHGKSLLSDQMLREAKADLLAYIGQECSDADPSYIPTFSVLLGSDLDKSQTVGFNTYRDELKNAKRRRGKSFTFAIDDAFLIADLKAFADTGNVEHILQLPHQSKGIFYPFFAHANINEIVANTREEDLFTVDDINKIYENQSLPFNDRAYLLNQTIRYISEDVEYDNCFSPEQSFVLYASTTLPRLSFNSVVPKWNAMLYKGAMEWCKEEARLFNEHHSPNNFQKVLDSKLAPDVMRYIFSEYEVFNTPHMNEAMVEKITSETKGSRTAYLDRLNLLSQYAAVNPQLTKESKIRISEYLDRAKDFLDMRHRPYQETLTLLVKKLQLNTLNHPQEADSIGHDLLDSGAKQKTNHDGCLPPTQYKATGTETQMCPN